VDESGEPVVGASVQVTGTNKGTISDYDGAFTISVPDDAKTLTVSFIGMKTEEVSIKNNMRITLHENTEVIQDIVVTGYGNVSKGSFAGSAQAVDAETIEKKSPSEISKALAGEVAGVQVANTSGQPGTNASIRIRGIGSVYAGGSPLYIVDGVTYEGDISSIDPGDIASTTILKDATATSLYGSRGANGVIMVTTKKAKAGNAVVNLDAKWGVNTKALQDYDYITDPGQYYESHYAALYNYYLLNGYDRSTAHLTAAGQVAGPVTNGGLGYNVYTVPEGQLLIGSNGKLNPAATLGNKVNYKGQDYLLLPDNWMKEAYTSSLRQEYNVNVSGTTGKASIYASFGYLNNKGIIRGADMYRYTARLKADYQAKEWLRIGMNAGYTNFNWNNGNSSEGSEGSTGNIFAAAASIAPIYPLYIRDGEGNILKDSHGYTRYD
jgi:TonB-linked SusC/RagA family outer membrane protein